MPTSISREPAITAFIWFDDLISREARRATDKFAPIREVFDLFTENFKKSYNPNKYGLKIWAAADSENAYTIHMQPYLRKLIMFRRKIEEKGLF